MIAIVVGTGDQTLNNTQTVFHSRQNPKGNLHGHEEAEERDYYPWWKPYDFVDIVRIYLFL